MCRYIYIFPLAVVGVWKAVNYTSSYLIVCIPLIRKRSESEWLLPLFPAFGRVYPPFENEFFLRG